MNEPTNLPVKYRAADWTKWVAGIIALLSFVSVSASTSIIDGAMAAVINFLLVFALCNLIAWGIWKAR